MSAINNAFGVHRDDGQDIITKLVALAQIAGIVVLHFNTALKAVGPWSGPVYRANCFITPVVMAVGDK